MGGKIVPLAFQISHAIFSVHLVILLTLTSFVGSRLTHNGNSVIAVRSEAREDALFLTPYIERGQIKEALKLATVQPMLKKIESFSGFLTVNKTTGSNLFFWLFKSQRGNWKERPLVVWLEGGPGASSLQGLFLEQGPVMVTKSNTLKRRRITLNRDCNLLFIDNPVGAGFSFTDADAGYARTDSDVVRDLYVGLTQFYQLFSALLKNKLFVLGASYGGKFVVGIGHKIFKMNKVSAFKMPLAGLMIGDGMISPLDMTYQASSLSNIGLIDTKTRFAFEAQEERFRNCVRAGEIPQAQVEYLNYFRVILNKTGLRGHFNVIHDEISSEGPYRNFLSDAKTKKLIHVGDHDFQNGSEVRKHIKEGYALSARPWLEELLTVEEFPILLYSGQLDLIFPYFGNSKFYDTLNWPRAGEYYTAKRCHFRVDGLVAGYVRTAGTLTEVLIRNAGHLISIERRKWAYVLMDRFITDSSSFRCA